MKYIDDACTTGGEQQHNVAELPMPEAHFRSLGIGSRATFFRWGKLGLKVLKIGGRRFIRPSDLAQFLEAHSQ